MKDIDVLIKQYGKFLYPVPTDDIDRDYLRANKRLMGDPLSCFFQLWPEGRNSLKDLSILSAGCGSTQAAVLAACNPYANVIGVDISPAAIQYQNLLKTKHNLNNLHLIEGDFRDLQLFNNQEFDLILCTGVVHHLNDPISGLIAINKLLKPEGVAHISVYSKYPRISMQPFKDAIRSLGATQTDESANFLRRIINLLHIRHPARLFSDAFADVAHNSELIDLYLHQQEMYFSIPELINILKNADLKIKSWSYPERVSLMYTAPELALKNEYWEIEKVERWHISERFEHSPQMHQFFAVKESSNIPSLALGEFNALEMYFRFWPGTKITNEKNMRIELNGKFIEFEIPGFDEVFKKEMKQIKQVDVLKHNPKILDLLIDAGIFQLSFVPFKRPSIL